jgi:hypothetical protein
MPSSWVGGNIVVKMMRGREMRNTLYALTCMVLITLACSMSGASPTADPGIIQTVIVSTAVAAQNQTQAANLSTSIPLPAETQAVMKSPVGTPTEPLSLVYEGLTISCSCANCWCRANVTITVRLTIDPQGNVTGILEQYLPETSDMMLVGTKNSILGAIEVDTPNEKTSFEFLGSLDDNLNQLTGTISFKGKYKENDQLYSGKRELLLFRK